MLISQSFIESVEKITRKRRTVVEQAFPRHIKLRFCHIKTRIRPDNRPKRVSIRSKKAFDLLNQRFGLNHCEFKGAK